jgi:hypothetical protein
MPTILYICGFRLFFVSFDGPEPVHVHVRRENLNAKVWLSPLRMAWSDFTARENREILRIVSDHEALIREKWHEHFGR